MVFVLRRSLRPRRGANRQFAATTLQRARAAVHSANLILTFGCGQALESGAGRLPGDPKGTRRRLATSTRSAVSILPERRARPAFDAQPKPFPAPSGSGTVDGGGVPNQHLNLSSPVGVALLLIALPIFHRPARTRAGLRCGRQPKRPAAQLMRHPAATCMIIVSSDSRSLGARQRRQASSTRARVGGSNRADGTVDISVRGVRHQRLTPSRRRSQHHLGWRSSSITGGARGYRDVRHRGADRSLLPQASLSKPEPEDLMATFPHADGPTVPANRRRRNRRLFTQSPHPFSTPTPPSGGYPAPTRHAECGDVAIARGSRRLPASSPPVSRLLASAPTVGVAPTRAPRVEIGDVCGLRLQPASRSARPI